MPPGQESEAASAKGGGESRRLQLIRASLLFQLKLLADGLRDFLLLPVSLVATVIGLLRSGDDPEREYEQVIEIGRQSERWINLFGTHQPFDEAGDAGNLDQLVTRAEKLLREQARQGDVSDNAAAALEKALSALHRRGLSAGGDGANQGGSAGNPDAQ